MIESIKLFINEHHALIVIIIVVLVVYFFYEYFKDFLNIIRIYNKEIKIAKNIITRS